MFICHATTVLRKAVTESSINELLLKFICDLLNQELDWPINRTKLANRLLDVSRS